MAGRVMRLLVVDDDEIWRKVLGTMFKKKGNVTVEEAFSGADAVEKVKNGDYDLVLMDMKMPSGTEGLDALKEIKRLKPQTQVVMMSAYGDIPKAVEAMRRGALTFVPKEPDFKDVITFEVNNFTRTLHLIADRELLIRSEYEKALRLTNTQAKGKALETLTAAVFASVDGFIEIDRNVHTATEEIDIVFRNESREPVWQKESPVILVECKNWKAQKVGKDEFVLFQQKMKNRSGRCELGFLVCTDKFAGTVKQEMIRSAADKTLIVPIEGKGLRQLVESQNRSRTLREFVDNALLI